MLGLPEILVLGSVIILISGRKKLPTIFSSLGNSVKSFKAGLEEDERQVREVEEIKNSEKKKKD